MENKNKKEEMQELGMQKYEVFALGILGHNNFMTPNTKTLEILGFLDPLDENFIGIALEELSKNFEKDYYLKVEEKKLYKVWKVEEKELF